MSIGIKRFLGNKATYLKLGKNFGNSGRHFLFIVINLAHAVISYNATVTVRVFTVLSMKIQ